MKEAGKFTDYWDFEVMQYGTFHQILLAYSNNPKDPILILDAHQGSVCKLTKE